MRLIYRVLYRVGFLPWDSDQVPDELRSLVEGPDALAPGRALDLGCGTGTHAVYMASHGWQVTGIDGVERALRRGRERATASGVTIEWLVGDVSRLEQTALAPGFTLLLDRGTYHGLSARERDGYVAGVTKLAAPGATLLMWAMAPNRRALEPAGADGSEIAERFAGWKFSERGRGWYQLVLR